MARKSSFLDFPLIPIFGFASFTGCIYKSSGGNL